jgi:obg-like ATPase 1
MDNIVEVQIRSCRFEDWNAKEVEFLNSNPLITAKPVVYLLNLSEKNFISKKSKWQRPVYEWVQVR